MSSFKVIYRIDSSDLTPDIMWEEGCPLLLDALQVSRDTNSGEAFLQTRFLNISGQTIKAFNAVASISLRDGSKETHALSPLDADIDSGNVFTAEPIKLNCGDVITANVVIQTVRYSTEQWSSAISASKLPKPPLANLSQKALKERALEFQELGCKDYATASSHSLVVHSGWTLCPCGQVNVGTKQCVKCGLAFSQEALKSTDENQLLTAAKTRAQREHAKVQEERNKATKRKKKILMVGTPLLLSLLSVFAFWFFSNFLPQSTAESKLSEFETENQLYKYDEWVDYSEWEPKSSAYSDSLNELIGSSYPQLTESSKFDVLTLLAKEQTIDSIYGKVKLNWAVNPKKLKVSLAIDDVTIEKDATKEGSFDVVINSREKAEWDNNSSSFRCRYRATFTPNIDNGTVDMWPLQRETTELVR